MPCVSLQRKTFKFQEEPSDLETQLFELGFLCENPDDVGSISASFSYNAHGSMVSMPHLSAMDWDFAEKLSHITRGTTEAYYSYDGNGIRTRKVAAFLLEYESRSLLLAIPCAFCAPVYCTRCCSCALRAVASVYLCNKIPRKSHFLRAFFVYIILKVFLPQCIIPA